MEDCVEQNYLTVQLEQINACRMYLKVTTLAKIADHMGTELLPQAFPNPNRLENINLDAISTSLLEWPHIAVPLATSWQLWSNTIRTLYTGSNKGTHLLRPLGNWLPMYAQQLFWKWCMPDSEHLLFQHALSTPTRIGLQTQQRRNMLKFSPTIPTTLEFNGPPSHQSTPPPATSNYPSHHSLGTPHRHNMASPTQHYKANSDMNSNHGNAPFTARSGKLGLPTNSTISLA